MHDYTIYGRWLRSAIPIPELRPRPMAPDDDPRAAAWRFEVASTPAPPLAGAATTGRDQLTDTVSAQLIRAPSVVRLKFDDTGPFDLTADGRIVWYPQDGYLEDVVRADLLGRVLPLALHERGLTSLHGSAVVLQGRAIAFLAPKNYGKSTLAMALVENHRARLLSDDTLVVSPETVIASPGVHSVRLWENTAERFTGLGGGRLVLSEKQIFEKLPAEWLADEAVPLEAIYTLLPAASASPEAVRRDALDGPNATVSLIQYQKLGALLGGADAARVFEYAATIASSIPVYALHVVRDLERLAEVTGSLAAWHGA